MKCNVFSAGVNGGVLFAFFVKILRSVLNVGRLSPIKHYRTIRLKTNSGLTVYRIPRTYLKILEITSK